MDEFLYQLKIPKERVAVLIGKNGETKRMIEEATGIELDIDSHEGDVRLVGDDALTLYTAREIVKAIGRGFNPDLAMMLLKQDMTLEIINVGDFVKSKGQLMRLRGRVIGTEGKSRKTVEDLTETNISVYGKTISILGSVERVELARRAVESLLSGSMHSNVYKMLEKRRREMRMKQMEE